MAAAPDALLDASGRLFDPALTAPADMTRKTRDKTAR
jgi:hypothetical protein